MAQKVITTLVDDLGGIEILDGEGETIRFAVDGASYEIDLNAGNAGKLRDALQPYIDHARRSVRDNARQGRSSSTASSNNREELAAARKWLKSNGHQVSDRGRIPSKLLELYRSHNR